MNTTNQNTEETPIMTKTEFGTIVKSNNRYLTNRKKEHFMIKHNGFGISTRELRRLYEQNVKEIIIYYQGANGTKIYKTTLWKYLESNKEYLHEGKDLQKFVNIKDMLYCGEETR